MKERASLKAGVLLLPYILLASIPLFIYNWVLTLREKGLPMSRDPYTILWVLLLTGLGIASTLFSVDRFQSLTGILLLAAFLFFFLTGKYIVRDKWMVLRLFLYSLSFINLFGLIQWIFKIEFTYSAGPIFINIVMPGGRISSLTANPNMLGLLACLSFLMALGLFAVTSDRLRKAIYLGLGVVALATLLLTQSRGALLGVVVGSLCILLLMRKKELLLVILVGAFLTLLIPGTLERLTHTGKTEAGYDISRKMIWESSLQMIRERPLVGFGPMSFAEVYPTHKIVPPGQEHLFENLRDPHNVFLRMAVEWGVPFAMLFLGGILVLALSALILRFGDANIILFSCVVSFMAIGLFDDPLFIAQLSSAFWLMLGLLNHKGTAKSETV